MALRARFAEAGGVARTDDERALLELLLAGSPYLTELLIRAPERLAQVAADPYLHREKPIEILRAQLAAEITATAAPAQAPGRALRRLRDREYVRLGARELGGYGTFEEVGRELAHLADACFEVAIGQPAAPFCVFALGKQGGEELNFSSDVDVLYVYGSDAGEAPGRLTMHEYFAKLADRATRLIAEPTEHGACFRVDLRLRPEGARGPLVNSLAALERYYETWGRPWERQAWIKARLAAGDPALAAETLALLAPFVYPRAAGPTLLDDVRIVLSRAQRERSRPGDVKLGPGGIREVEFFVQALQLLHGGKNPPLRERNTLRALDKLLFAGLISAREQKALSEAYVFLRRVENRLQLESGAQTHELPLEPERQAALAVAMGFRAPAPFQEALAAHRHAVREIWQTLGVIEPTKVTVDFGAVPFRDPEAAADEIELLARKPDSPFAPTASGPAAAIAPTLIEELAECPDPDQALRHLVDFVGRRGSWSGVWRLLSEHRPLASLLVSLFGTSEFLARRLVEHPDLIDQLIQLGSAAPRRTPEQLGAQLRERLAPHASDYEAALRALRRFKQETELAIGLHDIAGSLELDEVFEQLSALAEAIVQAALELIAPAPPVPLVVVALGKLGAREIDFGSDLDLLFVHGGTEVEDHERTARIAQRLLHALGTYLEEGRLYEIDTRLRPSGRQGLLVTTLPALRAYHDHDAQLWERQAWIKARPLAGDPALCAALEAARVEIVFLRPLPADAAAQIAHLRARMEHELAGEAAGLYNPKLGLGGLTDIEFIVQFQQLMHGGNHSAVRERGSRQALDALLAKGLLDPAAHETLASAYRFLRRLSNRLRIVHDRPASELRTESPSELDKLARRMGYRGRDGEIGVRLLEDYVTTTRKVRVLFERTFRAPCPARS
ncbi:MAG TPA: bifunctional [glutamate--ammonia ligase]-adenylyl-L-tyrosine phosphorylase/[glutamate--ammonia-ligase] adenylyltransferase [Polyangia bacterium]|nr:bifunctional [glutamate--ammonia ligase]-adenylyl-L-tyrosine phosphorylase/[glutamate--ammonia-ligase] adenylyltransferase [Polyangia bacterium]